LANTKVRVESVETSKQSGSSVSLDEEMVNLVRFQHGYNAAARMITVTDEMLDKIINGMGVVGR
ncbi:MAG: flagellar basal body rod C-terminal domain-containing protein, partial [Bacillus sp. (in: firmicutes)]